MASEATVPNTLRDIARRDDPDGVVACADLAAWERAEGPGSQAAARAVRRRDAERWVPGLPARRTYKVLGWTVLAAAAVDCALAWGPRSGALDTLDTLLRYGTAGGGVALAAWSLLSEVRGWEGSDAATWFAKSRIDRHARALEARRRALGGTAIVVGAGRLVLWREEGGSIARETVAAEAILDLALEAGARFMALRLTTSAGTRCFEWLPRDPAFEAAVARLAGAATVDRARAVMA